MPVILENGTDQIRTWLDPGRLEWSKELQSLLKPFNGELECYVVDKAVGKVGNNSPSFIVPVASTENKGNIANFFGNARKGAKGSEARKELKKQEVEINEKGPIIERESDEKRRTVEQSSTEDNATLPVPTSEIACGDLKREYDRTSIAGDESPKPKSIKRGDSDIASIKGSPATAASRKLRSATSNGTKASLVKARNDGSQRITNFFNK